MFAKNLFRLGNNSLKCVQINQKINSKQKFRNRNVLQNCGQLVNRCLSNGSNGFKFELPPLMDVYPKGSLSVFVTPIKINCYFKPLFDRKFNSESFLLGARQALSVISSHLANDNIEAIKPLVTEEAYEEISRNYAKYSFEQKLRLKVNLVDIQSSTQLNIRIDWNSWRVFTVKLVVMFDILNNSRDYETQNKIRLAARKVMAQGGFNISNYIEVFETVMDQKYLCVYQFSRKYESRVGGDWIVSKLVHYTFRDICKMGGLLSN